MSERPLAGAPAHAAGAEIWPRLLPVGDAALSVEFGETISPELNANVTAFDRALNASELPGIVETVPTYRSVLVIYDPRETSYGELLDGVRDVLRSARRSPSRTGRLWTVPVLYGPPFGDDLEDFAQRCGLSSDAVVQAHSSVDYLVYFLGFGPGIPIMGRLPPPLHVPRRIQPRPLIPAGSVVVAAAQASVVSLAVPSGWHILGRTPARLYRPELADPFLFEPGDKVRFYPVDTAEYARIERSPEMATPGESGGNV